MPSLDKLRSCILDLSVPIAKRTHAAFLLRTEGSLEAAQIISEALKQREDTALMRHELAYILGQMQKTEVCPLLASVLADEDDDVLVRHESAEALGALGDRQFIPILTQFSVHPAPEIAETCIIALDLFAWREKNESVKGSTYLSVDPAPGMVEAKSVDQLRAILMDTSSSLFLRYRAMFSLRDMNTDAAALALVSGFNDSSALFRHEVAYVLGQMQRSVTVDGLAAVLRNKEEHRMVRHEAAEAMGAIGGTEVEAILNEFKDDGEIVVEESCQVALNTIDYWASNEYEEAA